MNKALLFFLGSLVVNPVGYLAGTSIGGFVASSAFSVPRVDAANDPVGAWCVFGGASLAIAFLNLLLFRFLAGRVQLGQGPLDGSAPEGGRSAPALRE